jgi:flagellar hook assembly protein FlgD
MFLSMILLAVCAGLAYGQAGTAGYRYVRSEELQLLDIDLGNVSYDFSGNATIPFTLRGSRASVWLVVYTKDQPTEGGWGGPGIPEINGGHALNRKAGIPNMVRVVELGAFEEGTHTGTWDGKDWEGNAVAPGTYTLYCIGINNLDDVNWVGVSGWGFRNGGVYLLNAQGEGWIIGTGATLGTRPGGSREQIVADLGAGGASFMRYPIAAGNFLEHDEMQFVKLTEVPDYGLTDADGNPRAILGGTSHGSVVDPDDFTRWWSYQFWDGGIIGATVSLDQTTAEPLEGFGDPPASWKERIVVDENANLFNSLHFYEDKLYMGHGFFSDPPVSDIYELDSHTGEVTDIIDLSAYYVWERYNDDGSTSLHPSMVGALVIDDTGFIVCAGGWGGDSSTRSPTKVDWDGDLIYMNDAGDGFNDMVYQAEAEALGIEPRLDGDAHIVSGSAEGFAFVAEGSKNPTQPSWGAIYGPDGAGLIHVTAAKAPPSFNGAQGTGCYMLHEHSEHDGLYLLATSREFHGDGHGFQIGHLPFQISTALIGRDLPTAVAEISSDVTPDDYVLGDAYPNPFNAETTIEFAVPVEALVKMTVLNIQGQKVVTLVNEYLTAGTYRTGWDGTNASGDLAAGGLYFFSLQVGDYQMTKKMTLLK